MLCTESHIQIQILLCFVHFKLCFTNFWYFSKYSTEKEIFPIRSDNIDSGFYFNLKCNKTAIERILVDGELNTKKIVYFLLPTPHLPLLIQIAAELLLAGLDTQSVGDLRMKDDKRLRELNRQRE